jgi:transposase InsO family protein
VQYASAAYRQLLKAHGVIASMSRKGCCYDNAAAEAFFSTLKVECVYSDLLCDASKRAARNLLVHRKLL